MAHPSPSKNEAVLGKLETFNENATNLFTQIQEAKTEQSLTDLKDELEKIRTLANAGTEWWVDYDVRRSQETIANIEAEFDKARAKLRPRRRFRFKAETTAPTTNLTEKPVVSCSDKDDYSQSVKVEENFDIIGQSRVQNGVLKLETSESDGREVRIRDVKDAAIEIEGNAGAVRVNELKNCTLKVGNVAGPVYVSDCEHCTFHVRCRQLRIHASVNCEFVGDVKSAPIIEKCSEMSFRKWGAAAQIEKVMDFSWLKDGQSPNWKICEGKEE